MKSKLATVGVTCDCKGSQLLKGEAKFEKEEDKAGQKMRTYLRSPFPTLDNFTRFQQISHMITVGLSVPANVDRGQGGRIPREDGAQVLRREFPEIFVAAFMSLTLSECCTEVHETASHCVQASTLQ